MKASPFELMHVAHLLSPEYATLSTEIKDKVALNGALYSIVHIDERSFYAERVRRAPLGVFSPRLDSNAIIFALRPRRKMRVS